MTTDSSSAEFGASSALPFSWSGLPVEPLADWANASPIRGGSPGRGVQLAVLDRDGVIVSTNPAWDEFCLGNGGDLNQCGVGASYLDACRAAGDLVSIRVVAAIQAAARGDLPAPLIVLIPCDATSADGTVTPRWFDLSVSARLADDGNPLGSTVAIWPVAIPSARNRLLPLSESALDDESVWELLEAAPDGTVLVDSDGNIAYVNRQLEALTGYERADLLGRPLEILVPDDVRQRHQALHQGYNRSPKARLMGKLGAELEIRRSDGATVPVEIGLSPVRIGTILMTVASVRDVREQRAQRKALDALKARHAALAPLVAEVTALVLSDAPEAAVYQSVVDGARVLVSGDRAGLVIHAVLSGRATSLAESTIPGGAGEGPLKLLSPATADDSGVALLPHQRLPEELQRSYGTGLVAPFPGPAPVRGVLIALRELGREPFDGHDAELLDTFAQQVTIVLELGHARAGQQRLALLEDRQRIARDLHDTVIQEVIGVGMQLAAMANASKDPAVRDRNDSLIDQLDETVRRLRTVVFDARSQPWSRSVTETVAATIAEAARSLGHAPQVTVEGDLDALSPAVIEHLIPALREALSNVARHAEATSTQVRITLDEFHVVLTVDDDGQGIAGEAHYGTGLGNMQQRAALLGGTASLTQRPGGGSRFTWSAGALTD